MHPTHTGWPDCMRFSCDVHTRSRAQDSLYEEQRRRVSGGNGKLMKFPLGVGMCPPNLLSKNSYSGNPRAEKKQFEGSPLSGERSAPLKDKSRLGSNFRFPDSCHVNRLCERGAKLSRGCPSACIRWGRSDPPGANPGDENDA